MTAPALDRNNAARDATEREPWNDAAIDDDTARRLSPHAAHTRPATRDPRSPAITHYPSPITHSPGAKEVGFKEVGFADLGDLRRRLAALADAPRPETAPLPTGIGALDALLSARGIPRGRLTEIVGARGSGKTTLLRQLVATTVNRGGWVAYIDAARTLAPRDWAAIAGDDAGVWMVRPPAASRAAWCAEILLRSGAFALVVVDGALLGRATVVRLTRLARESHAALVLALDEDARAAILPGALRLRVARSRDARHPPPPSPLGRRERTTLAPAARAPAPARRPMRITVEKGGGGARRTVEVSYVRAVARRLCTHPEVPDRRGGAGRGSRTAGKREAGSALGGETAARGARVPHAHCAAARDGRVHRAAARGGAAHCAASRGRAIEHAAAR